MEDSDYITMFPNLYIENKTDYYQYCRFFFEDPEPCIDFVNRFCEKQTKENDFALRACKNNLSKECCKKHSKNNDFAYSICFQQVKDNTSSTKLIFIILLSIVIISCIIIFSIFWIKRR
jgi:hypothetical protein